MAENNGAENQIGNIKENLNKFKKSLELLSSNSDDLLKDGIKSAVRSTNNILSIMEHEKDTLSTSFHSRVGPLMSKAKYVSVKTIQYYEMRQYYGPEIISGVTLAVGTLFGLRRGKIPAFVMGSVAGTSAYGFVYGMKSPDFK